MNPCRLVWEFFLPFLLIRILLRPPSTAITTLCPLRTLPSAKFPSCLIFDFRLTQVDANFTKIICEAFNSFETKINPPTS